MLTSGDRNKNWLIVDTGVGKDSFHPRLYSIFMDEFVELVRRVYSVVADVSAVFFLNVVILSAKNLQALQKLFDMSTKLAQERGVFEHGEG